MYKLNVLFYYYYYLIFLCSLALGYRNVSNDGTCVVTVLHNKICHNFVITGPDERLVYSAEGDLDLEVWSILMLSYIRGASRK